MSANLQDGSCILWRISPVGGGRLFNVHRGGGARRSTNQPVETPNVSGCNDMILSPASRCIHIVSYRSYHIDLIISYLLFIACQLVHLAEAS